MQVQYSPSYVRYLPTPRSVIETNGGGYGGANRAPVRGDTFVAKWEIFYNSLMNHTSPKTSPAAYRLELELFRDMINLMK